jgi:putative ABC transport system ATP-binding protein
MLEAHRVGRVAADRDRWLLRDVSLSMTSGQRVGLVGPSGSGKTLLLRALALLDPLDVGELTWRAEPVTRQSIPHYRSRVIYLHQRPALQEGTVEQNLILPFTYSVHRARQFDRPRIERWLEGLGRDSSFLAQQSRDLSGGELQIAALLRAMQLDPEVLLLDEPTAALDQAATEAVERLIQQWQREEPEHRAFLIVSHNHHQVRRLVDRVIGLRAGRVEE